MHHLWNKFMTLFCSLYIWRNDAVMSICEMKGSSNLEVICWRLCHLKNDSGKSKMERNRMSINIRCERSIFGVCRQLSRNSHQRMGASNVGAKWQTKKFVFGKGFITSRIPFVVPTSDQRRPLPLPHLCTSHDGSIEDVTLISANPSWGLCPSRHQCVKRQQSPLHPIFQPFAVRQKLLRAL